MAKTIYKIVPASLWQNAKDAGIFKGAAIDLADVETEGRIQRLGVRCELVERGKRQRTEPRRGPRPKQMRAAVNRVDGLTAGGLARVGSRNHIIDDAEPAEDGRQVPWAERSVGSRSRSWHGGFVKRDACVNCPGTSSTRTG